MNVLVGITGSVAAYKAVYLIRALQAQGMTVRAVLTPSAREFIGAAGLEALTGHPVYDRLFGEGLPQSPPLHIALARWADLILVAPATADLLAAHAAGRADSLLLSILSVFEGPVLVAPAMHREMWEQPVTQDAVRQLTARGVVVIEPEEGALASGDWGKGRLRREEDILDTVARFARIRRLLEGKRVLVTYGRTEEPLDPVRVISNRSSGRMGYWLAWWARALGAEVWSVVGVTDVPPLSTPVQIRVRGVQDMLEALRSLLERNTDRLDYWLMAAAVSDFVPDQPESRKHPRTGEAWTLTLRPAPDLLATLSPLKGRAFWLGFALEHPETLVERAREKLQKKALDAIFANPLAAMGAATAGGHLIFREGSVEEAPELPKAALARWILERIAEATAHEGPHLAGPEPRA